MNPLSQISVVLPSLDPDEKLIAVVDGLLEVGFSHIILINDGSKPENLHYFTDLAAAHKEITLLHHEVNKGKGAALKKAFRWFLENRKDAKGVVTVDGDNQHHPEDTKACAERMLEKNRLVLGVRDFDLPHVPARSRAGNKLTSLVFKLFVGMTISDTQTGLRAIPTRDLPTLTQIAGDRFEYETNMLLAMKEHKIAFDEVKIRTVYIEENRSSHFHAIKDSWRIYKLIFGHFIKFAFSSVFSAAVDTALYSLVTWLLIGAPLGKFWTVTIATTVARVVSSLVNFFMNQRIFNSKAHTGKSLVRYFILAVLIYVGQILLNNAFIALFHVGESQVALKAVLYVVSMVPLFILSYTAQQRWVFSNKED